MGHTACIADMDSIVAATGESKKELNDKRINLIVRFLPALMQADLSEKCGIIIRRI